MGITSSDTAVENLGRICREARGAATRRPAKRRHTKTTEEVEVEGGESKTTHKDKDSQAELVQMVCAKALLSRLSDDARLVRASATEELTHMSPGLHFKLAEDPLVLMMANDSEHRLASHARGAAVSVMGSFIAQYFAVDCGGHERTRSMQPYVIARGMSTTPA